MGPLYAVACQSDWQQMQTPTITALNCFSEWELQSCLVPAIKFWTFCKSSPNLQLTKEREDSSRFIGTLEYYLLV